MSDKEWKADEPVTTESLEYFPNTNSPFTELADFANKFEVGIEVVGNSIGGLNVRLRGTYENVYACVADQWGSNEDAVTMKNFVHMVMGDTLASHRWNTGCTLGYDTVVESYDNPNLPDQLINLRAFNLVEGSAFMLFDQPDPRVWIVERVHRDSNFERVSIWAWDATENPSLEPEQAFNLDYCQPVALIGMVVDGSDHNNNDWGR